MVNKKIAHHIRTFLVGGAMGVANIIPGVSGGTIAVVFGIYEELMDALGNFLINKEKRWRYSRFLLLLFFGAVISVVVLARTLSWAFDNYELMTVYFFMGLILGSIPVVIKTHPDMKISISRSISFLLGVAAVVFLALIQTGGGTRAVDFDYTQYNIFNYLYYVFSGAIAASAMIIPGLSGSFILILLGPYRTVLDSISSLTETLPAEGLTPEMQVRLLLLGSLGIGVVIGVVGFAKFMSWALKHYPSVTLYAILGLLIGSFYQIFPGYELSLNGLGAVVTFVLGLIIALKFGKE